jgi:hypothetical protein
MSARQRWFSILIVALALALRVALLALRPAHFDEGVNGSFIDGMRVEGFYRYDPVGHWGPFEDLVLNELQSRKIPAVAVFNKCDLASPHPDVIESMAAAIASSHAHRIR